MGNKESIVHSIVVVYGILKEQIADTVTLLRGKCFDPGIESKNLVGSIIIM